MQMRASPGRRVEGEIILDPRVGPERRRNETPKTAFSQDPLQVAVAAPLDEDVEIGHPVEGGAEMLVALPMTIGEVGLVKPRQ